MNPIKTEEFTPTKPQDFPENCYIPLEDWLDGVSTNAFTDYDGYGFWAYKREDGMWMVGMEVVEPHHVIDNQIEHPSFVTYICWLNR